MTKKIHYHGHRKRLKDRFIENSSQLADYEILELLLGYGLPRKDTKPLAKELMARFGTLKGIFTASPEDLKETEGFGPGLKIFWTVLQEFSSRVKESWLKEKPVLNSPTEVVNFTKSRIGFDKKESFWVVLVDNKNRFISWELIGTGTVDQAAVYPREIFATALKKQASGLILMHNHPGGDPNPSSQDIELTRKIKKTSVDLGLRLLDHIIIAEESHFSFQDQSLI